MTRYTSGTQVERGYYMDPKSWSVEAVSEDGTRLPGTEGSYVKVPFPVLLLVVPVLGAAFLMFLPLIGFALLAQAAWQRVTHGAARTATELAASVGPVAHGSPALTGKQEEGGEAKPTKALAELEKEIAARKGEKQ